MNGVQLRILCNSSCHRNLGSNTHHDNATKDNTIAATFFNTSLQGMEIFDNFAFTACIMFCI